MDDKLFKIKRQLNLCLYATLIFSLATSMLAVVIIMYKYLVFSSPSPQREYYVKQCTVIDYDSDANTLRVKDSSNKVFIIEDYQEQIADGAAIDIVFCRSSAKSIESDDKIKKNNVTN